MKHLFLALLLLCSNVVYAWEPTKPINVIIGFAPGSGNELGFRGVSSVLEKANPELKFIIEHKPGADGIVGMNEFIKRPNNGYHIYVASHQGIWVTSEFFNPGASKYTVNDFEYVLTLGKSPLALIATEKSTVNDVPSFLEKIKGTSPVNIAVGSSAHKLAFSYILDKTKANREIVKSVNYKGPAQAAQDVAGGHAEFGILPAAVAASLEKSKKIKIIALLSEQSVFGLEHVPLINKWIPGLNIYAAWGILLPKDTDEEIINWYVKSFNEALKTPEVRKFFEQNYMFVATKELTPAGFRESVLKLRSQWIPVLERDVSIINN